MTPETYTSEVPQPKRVVPGQTWKWAFEIGNGEFYLEEVDEKRRVNAWASAKHVTIKRDDVVFVLSTRDAGPAKFEASSFDPDAVDDYSSSHSYKSGLVIPYTSHPDKKWTTCLIGNKIVWIEHYWFDHCVLVSDA